MAAMRANPRLQVGSAPWIEEERASALQIAEAETEEFTFSARNEVEWLNEHMAEIFSENNVNVAEMFRTPGKLRGKTPRTARKINPLESRPPLSDVFSNTPRGAPSPFKQTNYQSPRPTFRVAEDEPAQKTSFIIPEAAGSVSPIQRKPVPTNLFDSGYFGSQAITATQPNEAAEIQAAQVTSPIREDVAEMEPMEEDAVLNRESEGSFESAKEEQTRGMPEEIEVDTEVAQPSNAFETTRPVLESPLQTRTQQPSSPQKRSPQRSPERPAPIMQSPPEVAPQVEEPAPVVEDEPMEDIQSPTSDGSSPIRPVIVRKSSLNFASLPAREPITTKKSIGSRVSRTSQLDYTRNSYYGRATGGKSLGNTKQEELDRDEDEMDVDMDDTEPPRDHTESKMTQLHNKTSTQRLQDQISKLGQSQSHARPASKSIASNGMVPSQANQVPQPATSQETRQKSPLGKERPTPGAFPEDEEDSWIGPPTVAPREPAIFSPRPQLTKSQSTDVMDEIYGKDSIGGSDFNIPKRGEASPRHSPQRFPIREPAIPERTTSTLGRIKSVSTSMLRSPKKAGDSPGNKGISVSNPEPSIHSINEDESTTPPKSPIRSYRGSPLKAAKDKFSSILKTSRGLFASSAAVSAEAKSTFSPGGPSDRYGIHPTLSFEDVLSQSNSNEVLYPTLSSSTDSDQKSHRSPKNLFKSSVRKTRASIEKEERKKEEQAREAREAKEAQKMADQLEQARIKVKEEARVYHLEQERVAAMQKEVQARKEKEQQAKKTEADVPRATRSSPRKTRAQLEAEGIAAAAASTEDVSGRDVEMNDASTMPPPAAIPRPKSQIGRPGPKRPLKPTKEQLNKAKPPTVIRVDTGSQRGHQYHPSTSTLSATLQDSLSASGPSQNTLKKKASNSSIQSKASTNSFKSAASKALESAARKKEQDELATQRKREAKQEVERQRAANKEEERRKEEQQRRQEAERQRELQRERERANAAADAKKAASRQAIEKRRQEMERAKQMGAPPPAIRPQTAGMHKELPPIPVQRNEMGQAKAGRPQEDLGKPVNGGMQNSSKVPPKRPLQQDDEHTRPPMQRNGPSYHNNEPHSKRRKTNERFDDDDDDDDVEDHPKMTAPPIRQSSSRPKDVQTKSLFPSGYASVPPSNNLQRNTLISQHTMNQSKPAHPMDMAQVSKAPIPFASSSSQANAQPYKTPARPGTSTANGKSAASTSKPSPKYQNGENIELPEINTDSEDSDDEGGASFPVSSWADSPVLREQLARQEPMDPSKIFGNPGPLNMEEVFSKSKDRFGKFRNRTSSANWGGIDRLTEDEIRKDLQARDKLRRQGGWSYDSMV
ncbi:Inner centromere protein-related protein [Lachnellula occidentalis]|uniref:Inner centromere protein-related protein n=1 Tax=Lachnellula occidentalis TaxID=215460 RepID=A0A8H8RW29_9HELO|nr:Inner centromere protein-related protein [Lachnellula occidentalis]